MERIANVVLIVFGLLALMVLTMGLAISCREQPAEPGDGTATATLAGTLPGGTIDPNATATVPGSPTPFGGVTSTPIPGGPTATTDPNAPPTATTDPNASATPTPFGGATATPVPGGPTATTDPNAPPTATAIPNATPTPTPIGGATPVGPTPGSPTATSISGTPAPTATLPPGTGLTPGSTVQHRVARGEWLLQIARCYGVTYSSVRAANGLGNPDFIQIGDTIVVPGIGSAGRIIGPPCVQAYTVQTGDTWESLAARYGTTAAILQRANPGALTVGREIWVPRL